MQFRIDPYQLTAFALAVVRATAWLVVSPPFNTKLVPNTVKAGIAVALALSAAPHITSQEIDLTTGPFVAALLAQVLTGLAMGMLTALLFHAIQAAGSMVDLVAGYSLAMMYDPLGDAQTAVFGRAYQLLGITLIFVTNLHMVIVAGFIRSFEVVPIEGFSIPQIASAFTSHLGTFFVASLEVAGPVMACLFLTELALGLLSRAAPSLNIFALAFPIRVGVTFLVVAIAIPLVGPAVGNLVREGVNASLGG